MDNFLILKRLDRLERLITANKEVLTFEEIYDYIGQEARKKGQIHIQVRSGLYLELPVERHEANGNRH